MAVLAIDRRQGPLVAFATRAHPDPHACLLHALEELAQSRESIAKMIAQQGVPADGAALRTMQDHFTYYARADRLPLLDFVRAGPRMPLPAPAPPAKRPAEMLAALVDRLRAAGFEPIGVDVTPPDLEAVGVRVHRALVPGLQPVSFGTDFRHRGGPRLYQAPVAMGLRSQPRREDQLNPCPLPGG
jgi:ribosomal protein S12 methylthiotransferase accessory factor